MSFCMFVELCLFVCRFEHVLHRFQKHGILMHPNVIILYVGLSELCFTTWEYKNIN